MFYGWVIVALTFVAQFIVIGTFIQCFPVFLLPLAEEFEVGRGTVALPPAALLIVGAVSSPLIGRAVGRYPIRNVMLVGAASMAAGFALLASAQAFWQYLVVFGVTGSVAMGALGSISCNTLIVNWFERRRSMALGLAMTGMSLSGAVLIPITSWATAAWGWRGVHLAFAGVAVALMPVIALLVVTRPSDRGLRPDGDEVVGVDANGLASLADGAASPDGAGASPGVGDADGPPPSTRTLLASPVLWLISATCGLVFFSATGLMNHGIAFAIDRGIEPLKAAVLLSAISLGAALGKLAFGWLADRAGERAAFGVALVFTFAALAGFAGFADYAGLVAAAALFGLGIGGVAPLQVALLARHFGSKDFAPVMGLVGPLMIPFQITGPPLAGWIYDTRGSYALAIWIFMGATVLGGVMLAMIRPRGRSRLQAAIALVCLSTISCSTLDRLAPAGDVGLVVSTRAGRLAGTESEGVRRYLGIPFAAPPVGPRRFRAPAPPEPWEGVREARRFSPVCAQARVQAGAFEVEGDEDCLYLNVYAPADAAPASRGPNAKAEGRPVLVWIHGGGRRVGDGRRDVSTFVRETQSVVVTIQYRLSHFAFFAHPALSAEDPSRLSSGNYGFQDAIAALRWVREEVAAFGGDAGRVTIGGLSGGGSMVCGLLVSPQAAGLFDGALIQSGSSCWFPTDTLEFAEARGRRNAEALGCDGDGDGDGQNEADVAACLRALAPSAFYAALGRMLDNPYPAGSTESFAAMPLLGARSGHHVDGHVFPRSWPQAYRAGTFHRVPVMMGVAAQEGRLIYGQLLYDMGSHAFGQEDYRRALLGLTGSASTASAAAERFPLAPGASAAETFSDVATHAHYTCPLAEMAAALGRYTPTYFYEYQVPGPSTSERITLGAYHGADTDTLFGDGYREKLPPFGPRQVRAARNLRAYVAQFLRTGDPNGEGLPAWPRHTVASGERHLAFDDTPHPDIGLRAEACAFWREQDWEALPPF